MVATRAVTALKIHCPVDAATLRAVQAGDFGVVDAGSPLGAMMQLVRGDNPLGDFGLYQGVMELSGGWELFTPAAGASPALGDAGVDMVSPTAILTVYVPADAGDGAVSQAIAAIMAVHPWEVPVIEISETALLVRG